MGSLESEGGEEQAEARKKKKQKDYFACRVFSTKNLAQQEKKPRVKGSQTWGLGRKRGKEDWEKNLESDKGGGESEPYFGPQTR